MTYGITGHRRTDLRVLVVGAGIAGLGAARALRRRGLIVDVVERAPSWTHTGTGIYLPGNAVRALRALGLESAVAERGSVIPHQRLCDHRGRLLADIDLAALWGDVGRCLAVHRADLHEVLASHGEPVPVRLGRPVRRINQHGTASVGFGDGSSDRYDLVIGADGIRSTVRELAIDVGAVRQVGQLAWRFVTECPPEVTSWTVLLGCDVTFLAVPIGRGQVYCYCDTPARGDEAPQATESAGRLAELLTGFASPVPAILNTLGSNGLVHAAPIEEVRLNTWSRGPILLIGDAAHATSPNMAEGGAMALEDGLILAECLADSSDVAEAVARFQARRRPRTQWVLAQTHRRDRTRNLPPAVRNLVLRRWGRRLFHASYRPLLDPP